MPDSELPARLPRPLEGAQRDRVKKLKKACREIAQGLAMAPEILLAAKDYEVLVRIEAGEAVAAPASWQGWRQQTVIAPLRAAVSGERS